jgi:hypothetical protein
MKRGGHIVILAALWALPAVAWAQNPTLIRARQAAGAAQPETADEAGAAVSADGATAESAAATTGTGADETAPVRSYPPPPPRWTQLPPVQNPLALTRTGEAAPTAPTAPVAPTAPPPVAVQATPAFPYGPPPEPERAGVYRRFSMTAALGPGRLIGPGEQTLAVSYQVARAGLGLDRNLNLQLSYEGIGANSENNGQKSWLKQDILSAGLQRFISERVYIRGGLGIGFVSEKIQNGPKYDGGKGISALAAFGYEVLQMEHLALGLDLHASLTHYPDESWKTIGLDLTISVF